MTGMFLLTTSRVRELHDLVRGHAAAALDSLDLLEAVPISDSDMRDGIVAKIGTEICTLEEMLNAYDKTLPTLVFTREAYARAAHVDQRDPRGPE